MEYTLSVRNGFQKDAVLIGTLDECKQCAEACETPPLVLDYEPDLSDVTDSESAELMAAVRRVALSGWRLQQLITCRVPGELVDLELSIMRRASKELGAVLSSTPRKGVV